MADLHSFEGFETCGSLTGKDNRAATLEDVTDRLKALEKAVPSSTDPWLVDNEGADGYALHMSDGTQQHIVLPLPDSVVGQCTGALAPIITVGVRVHFPDPATAFNCLLIRYRREDTDTDSVSSANVRFNTDGSLSVRRGSSVVATTSAGVVTLGAWHYIELSCRTEQGPTGLYGLAEVAGVPPEGTMGSEDLSISDTIVYREIWDSTETYSENDLVRWKGRAYIALAPGGTNLDQEPGVATTFWSDEGLEDDPSNLLGTPGSFGGFYILEDPNCQFRSYLFATGDPATVLTNTGTWNYSGGDYEPSIGDTVVIGANPYWELKVDGTTVLQGYSPMGPSNTSLDLSVQDVAFEGPGGMSATGDEYVSYDDIYITINGDPLVGGFIGPCIVESLRPIEDIDQEWTTSSGSDHFSTIGTNGNNEATYNQAVTNGVQDRFLHQTSSNKGTIFAVQMEAQVVNTTGGSPSLEISIGPANEITEDFVIENTSGTDLYRFFSETKPGGGEWDFTALNELVTGLKPSGL